MFLELKKIPDQIEFYSPEEIPRNRDCFLQSAKDEKIIQEQWVKWANNYDDNSWKHPNWLIDYTPCHINSVNELFISLAFMINSKDRFHIINILLPRQMLKAAFLPFTAEKRPYIIVDETWHNKLFNSSYSIYCLINLNGIREIIATHGEVLSVTVNDVQAICETLGNRNEDLQITIFSDNILVKLNWKPDTIKKYNPELFVDLMIDLMKQIEIKTNVSSYAVFTQGANYLNEDEIEKKHNHKNVVSIQSISAPFIEAFEIDNNLRSLIRKGELNPKSLYIENSFYLSMNRKYNSSEEPLWFKENKFNSEKNLRNIVYYALDDNEYKELVKGKE